MGRIIGAVVGGLIVLYLWMFISLTAAWFAFGPERAFKPGTTDVTIVWLLVALPLTIIGAVLAGWTAAIIGQKQKEKTVKALALTVLVIWLALAIWSVTPWRSKPPVAATELGTFEAMNYADQPFWYDFLLPFIGAAAIMWGGRKITKYTDWEAMKREAEESFF